jgi:hypothetical protein
VSKVLVVHDGKRERELCSSSGWSSGAIPACDISVDDVCCRAVTPSSSLWLRRDGA